MKDIIKMNINEITKEIDKKKKELCDLKIDKVTGGLKNKSLIKNTKKQIARLMTVLNSKGEESES